MEGRRVSHSWCKCVVGHSYVGSGGAGMEMVADRHAEQSQEGVGRMSGDAGALPECKIWTMMTPDLTAFLLCCRGRVGRN